MKNFNFSKTMVVYLFFAQSYALFGQNVIVENIQTQDNPLKVQCNFNQENYTLIKKGNKKIYTYTQPFFSNLSNGPVKKENAIQATLNIELVFDSNEFEIPWGITVYDESGNSVTEGWQGTNPISVNLPNIGTYDVFTEFYNGETSYFVIKEMINVEENTSIQINVAEASNYVKTDNLRQNGDPLRPGIYDPGTGTTTGGNSDIFFLQRFNFNPFGIPVYQSSYSWIERLAEDESPSWNFYINNISERYSILQECIGTGYDGEKYFIKHSAISEITQSTEINNLPENLYLHQEKIQPSILGEQSNTLSPAIAVADILVHPIFGNQKLSDIIIYNPEYSLNVSEGVNIYMDNPIDGNNLITSLVMPIAIDMQGTVYEDWGEEFFYIGGNTIGSGNENEILYGSGSLFKSFHFLGESFYNSLYGYQGLPFHPKFSFSSIDNPQIILGDNTPIQQIGVGYDYNYQLILKLQYKGRYGEVRESDAFAIEVLAKQDGNTIFEGEYIDFIHTPIPSTGEMEITFSNANVMVDDIIGKNNTTVHFNAGEADDPPTLQHLQFRNTSGKVTDRFASAAEGIVRLTAGDFQFLPNYLLYEYREGSSVEFFYSPYDQNNWTELTLTKYPDYFNLALGDYYEAPLTSIESTEDNAWYDVKIICTDASGNKQEQIVSPSFKLNDTTLSIEQEYSTLFSVHPNPSNDRVYLEIPENFQDHFVIKIIDFLGRNIYTEEHKNNPSFVLNISTLSQGTYILSIESEGRKLSKKIIKK